MDSRWKFEQQRGQSSSENRGEDSKQVTRGKEENDNAQAAVGVHEEDRTWVAVGVVVVKEQAAVEDH